MLRTLGSAFANPEVEIIGPQPHTRHTDGDRRPLFFRKRVHGVDCVSVLSVDWPKVRFGSLAESRWLLDMSA